MFWLRNKKKKSSHVRIQKISSGGGGGGGGPKNLFYQSSTYFKKGRRTDLPREAVWASTRENRSLGFPIKWYSNQPAQLQTLGRKLKFHS